MNWPGLGHVRARHLGDAEVHDLDRAVLEQADVGGLDVAVDDAAGVGVVQPLGRPATMMSMLLLHRELGLAP